MKSYPSAMDLPLIPDREPRHSAHARAAFPAPKSTRWAPHEVILHRAHAIWEREGFPENRALANWLEAEVQIMGRP